MPAAALLSQINFKDPCWDQIIDQFHKHPQRLEELFDGLNASEARIKFGCSKLLRLLATQDALLLYPYWERFVGLLEHTNSFLKWDAIRTIGCLVTVDVEKRFDRIMNRYLEPIDGPVMITAANIVQSASTIALARPELAITIAHRIMAVEDAQYKSTECRNVALGHAIESFGQFIHLLPDKKPVLAFVQRQLNNKRPATRAKAEKFLKRELKGAL